LDGVRVGDALLAALGAIWQEQNPFFQWELSGSPSPTPDFKLPSLTAPSGVGADVTWDTFDSFDPSIIDDGVFDVAALDPQVAGYSAQQIADQTGFSAQGTVFETGDGRVGYADADRRSLNAQDGFITLPSSVLERQGFSVSSDIADLVNQVTVEFDGGVVTDSDDVSVGLFGPQQETLNTILADQSNAESLAAEYLLRHSAPSRILDELSLSLLNVDDSLRDELLTVNVNDAVAVTGLPSKVGFNLFQGFVEGYTFVFDRFDVRLRLNVSELFFSVGDPRWSQLADSLAWQDVGAGVTWEDSRSLVG
jgi:hypothetical protein